VRQALADAIVRARERVPSSWCAAAALELLALVVAEARARLRLRLERATPAVLMTARREDASHGTQLGAELAAANSDVVAAQLLGRRRGACSCASWAPNAVRTSDTTNCFKFEAGRVRLLRRRRH
jgi:hypothetical protein